MRRSFVCRCAHQANEGSCRQNEVQRRLETGNESLCRLAPSPHGNYPLPCLFFVWLLEIHKERLRLGKRVHTGARDPSGYCHTGYSPREDLRHLTPTRGSAGAIVSDHAVVCPLRTAHLSGHPLCTKASVVLSPGRTWLSPRDLYLNEHAFYLVVVHLYGLH